MAKKNILTNISLEQYNKKYHNRKYRLVKYSKKEVEDFDKKNNSTDNLLLRNRKWALIKDTYYEIPKPIRFTWFRNLNTACQIGTCVLAAGVVATAIAVPLTVIKAPNEDNATVDTEVAKYVNIKYKGESPDGGKIYEFTPTSEETEVTGIESVYIGEDKLIVEEEYTFNVQNSNSLELIIKKVAFEKHKGDVKIKPSIDFPWKEKEVTYNEFAEQFTTWLNNYTNSNFDYSKKSIPNIYILSDDGNSNTKYAVTGVYNKRENLTLPKHTLVEYSNNSFIKVDINYEISVESLVGGKYYSCKNTMSYINSSATGTAIKSLKINKYGIVSENIKGNGNGYKLDVINEPDSVGETTILNVRNDSGKEVTSIHVNSGEYSGKIYVYDQNNVNITTRCAVSGGPLKAIRMEDHFIFTSLIEPTSHPSGIFFISRTNPAIQISIGYGVN